MDTKTALRFYLPEYLMLIVSAFSGAFVSILVLFIFNNNSILLLVLSFASIVTGLVFIGIYISLALSVRSNHSIILIKYDKTKTKENNFNDNYNKTLKGNKYKFWLGIFFFIVLPSLLFIISSRQSKNNCFQVIENHSFEFKNSISSNYFLVEAPKHIVNNNPSSLFITRNPQNSISQQNLNLVTECPNINDSIYFWRIKVTSNIEDSIAFILHTYDKGILQIFKSNSIYVDNKPPNKISNFNYLNSTKKDKITFQWKKPTNKDLNFYVISMNNSKHLEVLRDTINSSFTNYSSKALLPDDYLLSIESFDFHKNSSKNVINLEIN